MENLYSLLRKINQSVNWNVSSDCAHSSKVGCDCIACTSGQYFDGRSVDYSCEQRRQIYILRYLHVHLQEICSALEGLRHDKALPSEWPTKVRVLSIGGGPGSDIAGFRRFVTQSGFYAHATTEFEIVRVDRVTEWDNLALEVFPIFSKDGITFKHSKIHVDVNGLNPSKYGMFDIVMLSYLVSELDEKTVETLAGFIRQVLASKAVVVINDRNEDAVVARIDRLLSHLKVLSQARFADECWCGILYPDDLIGVVKPKRNMTSIRLGAIVEGS